MNDHAIFPTQRSRVSPSEGHNTAIGGPCALLTPAKKGFAKSAALREIIRLFATMVADELLTEQRGEADFTDNQPTNEPDEGSRKAYKNDT